MQAKWHAFSCWHTTSYVCGRRQTDDAVWFRCCLPNRLGNVRRRKERRRGWQMRGDNKMQTQIHTETCAVVDFSGFSSVRFCVCVRALRQGVEHWTSRVQPVLSTDIRHSARNTCTQRHIHMHNITYTINCQRRDSARTGSVNLKDPHAQCLTSYELLRFVIKWPKLHAIYVHTVFTTHTQTHTQRQNGDVPHHIITQSQTA